VTNILKLSRNGFYGVFTLFLFLLPGIILAGCDILNTSLVDYYLEHSEIVEATGLTVKTEHIIMDDGTILIPSGEATIGVFLSNPRNFNVRRDLLGASAGVTVRQISFTEIEVHIDEAKEGDYYDLTLAMQSPDGLRDFPPYPLRIRCLSFEAKLLDFTVNGETPPVFDPAQGAFTVNVPYTDETVVFGTTTHPEAVIEIYAGADDSGELLVTEKYTAETTQSLELGDNHFYIRITAPSSTVQSYAVIVYRASDSEKALTGFYFAIGANNYGVGDGVVPESGSINGNAITITLPYGTDVTAMTASAAYIGSSINPDPASARSYASPVSYTVTAANGSSAVYTVAVKVVLDSAKAITDFTILTPANAAGIINEELKTITVNVPYGTGVTAMTASAAHTGASISPDPGSAKSYANPVNYTVTAADGSQAVYTVTVTVGSNSAKAITDFYFAINAKHYGVGAGVESGSGSISGNNVTVIVPYGTDVSNMTATASHTGTSISPDPASPRSYANPVSYTVTAADNTTAKYTVTVTAAPNPARAITDFSVLTPTNATGMINEELKTITVNVPHGTDVTAMTAAASHSAGASISPDPGSPRSYANPVSYTVTAADGSHATYTVTVRVGSSSAKAMTAFHFAIGEKKYGVGSDVESGSGSISGNNITVILPYGTDVTAVTAAASYTGASISPDPGSPRSYAKPVNYTVVAADGSQAVYTVTVTVASSSAKTITAFYVAIGEKKYGVGSGVETGSGSINGNNITVIVPYGTDVAAMTAAASHSAGASISPDPGSARSYAKPVSYTVVAADGSHTAYTVTVTAAPNPAKAITAFSILTPVNVVGSINGNSITVTVPHGTAVTAMTASATHTGASISPDPASPRSYANPVEYTVTAADNTSAKYTVTVTVAPNPAKAITAFSILMPVNVVGSINGNNITVTVPYGTDVTAMTAAASHSAGASISPDPESARSYAKPVNYTVTAADSSQAVYTVTVTVASSSAKAMTAFYVAIGEKKYGVGSGVETGSGSINGNSITVTVPHGTAVTAMTASAAHTGASISPDPASPRSYANSVEYTVTAADGTTAKYAVTITVAPNTAKAITAFSIQSPVNAAAGISGNNITVTVPYGTVVTAMTASATHTGASISPDPASSRSYANPVEYTVTAADNTTAKYTVTVTVAPNPAKAITAFSILTPVNVVGSISGSNITVTVPYGTAVTAMTASATHTGASISPDPASSRSYANPVDYTVTAADGTTAKYTVTVTVALNTAKAITAFSILTPVNAVASISGNSITVTVPYGTDLSNMTATASRSAGASISPDPASPRSYAGPATYTVTPEDKGTPATYTVTVNVAKIKTIENINKNDDFHKGFVKTGSDISSVIKAAITSVTGTDSLDKAITLAAEDYSVDALNPTGDGESTTATLRVPAAKSSTGADIAEDFMVYIKSGKKDITAFYFTIGGKNYGVDVDFNPVLESGSGSISGNNITVTVPYGTDVTAMTASATHTGASISPDPASSRSYANPVEYTVTAEDGSQATYTVTVTAASGITIRGITVEGLAALTFSGAPSSPVTPGASVTITISGDTAVTTWYVDINGPVTPTASTANTVIFAAPSTPGFYNVNAIAVVNGIPYSGFLGLIVK
jgi:hypothetical protein